MKKIFTLSIAAVLGFSAMAQNGWTPRADEFGKAEIPNKKLYLVNGKVTDKITPRPANKAGAVTGYIDYFDVERDGYAFGVDANAPQFYWTFQDSSFINIGTAFSHLFFIDTYAWVPFDTLKDAGATKVVIDTIYFNFSHVNHSGTPNTLAVTVKELPLAGPLYNGTILWHDTTTSTDFTPGFNINQLPVLRIPCGVELTGTTLSRGVYIEVHFDGPVNDTASFLANYYNSGQNCPPLSRDGSLESFSFREHGITEGRTQYRHDYNSQRFNYPVGTYYSNLSTYYDCNSNGSYDKNTNEAFAMQNMSLGYSYTATGPFIGQEELALRTAKVGQNYPNPFSGVTTVKYTVTESTNISVEVFDITGKSVLKQNEGTKPAGSYLLNIDGSSLNSGVYYYTFRTDHGSVTKKMILQH